MAQPRNGRGSVVEIDISEWLPSFIRKGISSRGYTERPARHPEGKPGSRFFMG